MEPIEQKLNDYIWENIGSLEGVFSEKIYKILLGLKESNNRESFSDTLEAIVEVDNKLFEKIFTNYTKYNKTLESYQKAIEKNPKNENAYYHIGIVYAKKKEYDKAIENYFLAIKINPKNDRVYNNIGMIYFEQGNEIEGIKKFEKAIEINPENHKVFNKLNGLMKMSNRLFFLNQNNSSYLFKINKIKIKNFKQYKNFSIDFSKQINIIIGQNATGKTTLLQAITLGLLKEDSLDARKVEFDSYISKGEEKSELVIYHNDEEKKVDILKEKREIENNYFIPFLLAYGSNFFTSKTNEVKEVAQSIINHTIHKEFTSSIFVDYTSGFVNPIRLLEFLDLEKDKSVLTIQKTFINTINSFLEGYKLIGTEDKNYFFQKNGSSEKLTLEELSEGYRGNVLLITDMLIKILGVGWTPQTIEGIVLIDEFDKHLHPKWQSKLVNKLTEVFPKIQFIMTTHNPMSILDREPDEITILKEIDGEIVAVKGGGTKTIDVSTVLLEYFGVKSTIGESMQEKIRTFNRLKLQKELNKNEKQKLKELEEFLGNTVASNFIYNRPYLQFLNYLKEHKDINFDKYEKLDEVEMKELLEEFGDLFDD